MKPPMGGNSTVFLQAVVVLIGVAALVFLLWEPQLEGRNARATLFEIYFKDPFLAYAYLSSIPFFMGVARAFRVPGCFRRGQAFSPAALQDVRTISLCALVLIGLVALAELFILLGESDDRAGGVFMGLLITFGSVIVASSAAVFERILRDAGGRT